MPNRKAPLNPRKEQPRLLATLVFPFTYLSCPRYILYRDFLGFGAVSSLSLGGPADPSRNQMDRSRQEKTVAIFWRTVRPLDMPNQNSEPSDKICPGNDPVALQRLNERNRQFWIEQSKLLDERISNETLYKTATDDMNSEILRCVPVKSRKSLEQALADAETTMRFFQSAFSQKGGRTRKNDALQDLILELVGEDQDMTESELLDKLKGEAGAGVVTSIDEPSALLAGDIQCIHFVNDDGRPKRASVYGLKDRLSRAKTKIKNSR